MKTPKNRIAQWLEEMDRDANEFAQLRAQLTTAAPEGGYYETYYYESVPLAANANSCGRVNFPFFMQICSRYYK